MGPSKKGGMPSDGSAMKAHTVVLSTKSGKENSVKRVMLVALTVAMIVASSVPAVAEDPAIPPTPTLVQRIAVESVYPDVVDDLGSLLVRGVDEVTMPIGPSGSSEVVLRYEGSNGDTKGVVSPAGVVSPDWYIGFGWYIYFYIAPGDWGWFTGLALPALSVVICGILALAGVSGTVCGLIAVALIYVFATYSAPPPGYCKEIKFNYVGTLTSVKNVQMSC